MPSTTPPLSTDGAPGRRSGGRPRPARVIRARARRAPPWRLRPRRSRTPRRARGWLTRSARTGRPPAARSGVPSALPTKASAWLAPSMTVTTGSPARPGGAATRDATCDAALASQRRRAARPPVAIEPVRRREAEHRRLDALLVRELLGGRERLGHDRAAAGEDDAVARTRAGLAQPEPARDDVRAQPLLADSRDGLRERRLVDRLRREAQVQRLAVRLLHPRERIEQQPFELPRVARLGVCQPGRLDPDPGGDDRLVRAALARERDPRRRARRGRSGCRSRPSRRSPRARASRTGRTACRSGTAARAGSPSSRPSCPSSSTRFISAMPISMCWPRGPTRHFSGESSIAS